MPPSTHLLPLALLPPLTLGGLIPFFLPRSAILAFGLPARIADCALAHPLMVVCSARSTALGALLGTFYYQGKYAACDAVLLALGYVGLVDGWTCWREGNPRMGVVKALVGVVCAGWGWREVMVR
jgi:hypothetical protein